jgi:ATP-binding cassette subfamily E protein 1
MRRVKGQKKTATVDTNTCDPEKCDPDSGICRAAQACPRGLIEQEAFDQPMIFQDMCQGCGDCTDACPLDAIDLSYSGRTM